MSVEDLAGEEAEQHRRTVRIRNLAIGGLASLTVVAMVAAVVAFNQRSAARRSEGEAKAQQLNAERSAEAERRSAKEAEERRLQAEAAETLATERAEEAALQSSIAKREAHAARVALSQASTQEAVRRMEANEPREALPFLARALRADPDSMAARSWVSDLINLLSSSEHPRRQEHDRSEKLEDARDRDAQQPEWQQDQPHDRIQDKCQERERPAEHEQNQPEQKLAHIGHIRSNGRERSDPTRSVSRDSV